MATDGVQGMYRHARPYEHGVVAHHQVILRHDLVFVDGKQPYGFRPVVAVVDGEHECTVHGRVVERVGRDILVNSVELSTLPDAGRLAVVLHGDHGLGVDKVVARWHDYGLPPCTAFLADVGHDAVVRSQFVALRHSVLWLQLVCIDDGVHLLIDHYLMFPSL